MSEQASLSSSSPSQVPLGDIETFVKSVQFGVVQIIIQNGHVVQIEKTEKIRLR